MKEQKKTRKKNDEKAVLANLHKMKFVFFVLIFPRLHHQLHRASLCFARDSAFEMSTYSSEWCLYVPVVIKQQIQSNKNNNTNETHTPIAIAAHRSKRRTRSKERE